MNKILAVVGPTASGKTALAISLAKECGGEVISADSRQGYRGFDTTTVKVTKEEMDGIPHHLLDVTDIENRLSVSEYKTLAEEKIKEIQLRGKLPILCGGTGYYIDAVLYNRTFPEVPENKSLREELGGMSAKKLLEILTRLDPERAETIEQENPRRLIRAIEIATALGKVPEIIPSYDSPYDVLTIGLAPEDETLRERIRARIAGRIDAMIEEIKTAYDAGILSEARALELGFDFSLIIAHLKGEMDKAELEQRLEYGDWQYAKRQMRWFKRNPHIWWTTPDDTTILPRVEAWLQK